MPKLSQHQSNEYTKMLILGDPGTGKTGCLASLVKADYHLGIVDLDNGLDAFKQFVIRDCPDKIDNVNYITLRDKKVPGPNGPMVEGQARAYLDAVKMTERWKDGDIDLGNPWKWGPEHILVLDSGTFLATAAYDWREQMIPAGKSGKYDQRAVYYDAQKSISSLFATLTGEAFRTNVIIITHIRYQEAEDGMLKGYPNTIGQALSTMIGAYFNTIVLCQSTQGGKRVIRTLSTQQIDLKNPKPFAMGPQYPIETGLAEIFKTLRGPSPMEVAPPPKPTPPQSAYVKPKQLQLKRI